MKPFECLDEHGQIHLHQDNWRRWRDERLSAHPCEGKWRFDLQLEHSRTRLETVPATNQRVHGGGFHNHTCFYDCADWSTIYGAHLFRLPHETSPRPMIRMIVESQNPEPIWGERVTLLSSSTYFKCEPWGRNVPNQFAYFRGQYWQVTFSELLHHEFPAGVGYPLRDGQGGYGQPRRGGRNPLRGYTANQILDVGYFYAPYIPLTETPVVLDPNTFNARRGFLTRYGERLLRTDLYERIHLGDWNFPQPEFKLDWRKYGF